MSGWTVITVRGKPASAYDYTHKDHDHDRSYATYDLVATFEEDRRIRAWESHGDCVYALLACARYDWDFAESLLEDYGDLVDDAVVLGWNDTTDTGAARYYHRPDLGGYTHQYDETGNGEKGERACAMMYAHHGINAKNPFHNPTGRRDDRYLDNGNVQEDCHEHAQ